MDLDLDLDAPRTRSPLEQAMAVALLASNTGGQLLRTLWRLLGNGSAGASLTGARPSRSHQIQMQLQRRHQPPTRGGDGDFLRCEERLLGGDKRIRRRHCQYPRLMSVACGFPKDYVMYPNYERGKFGEDAWFQTSTPHADTLGVADGVGGWRNYGIDPGQFSQFLMRSCSRLSNYSNYDPRRLDLLLNRAYLDLLEQKCPILGSCTVCLLSLNRRNSTIYTANIGDSGFLAVRSGRVLCRSYEQQHQFNTPYQLASPPPCKGGQFLIDSPDCAECQKFVTRRGDVLLLATDGVYDNVPMEMLLEILEELAFVENPVVLQMAANGLALMAKTLSTNPLYDSPFSQNARKQKFDSLGGKPDDITVLLASVV